jgi:hypothetical protein
MPSHRNLQGLQFRDAGEAALLRRDGNLAIIDKDKRIVEVSLTSETPVQRWGDIEILSHADGHIRLDRLRNVGAFHLDHDTTKRVAAIEDVQVRDRKVHVRLRFGRTALADDAWKDVEDGILKGTSAGYRVHKVESDVDARTYTAVDWEIYEGSFTSIPADPNVGVGRSADDQMTLWRSLTTATTSNHAAPSAQEKTVNKLRAVLALIAAFPHAEAELTARAEKITGDTLTEAQHIELRACAEGMPVPGDEKKRAADLAAAKAQLDMVTQARSFEGVTLSEDEINGVRTLDDARGLLLRKVAAVHAKRPEGQITTGITVTADATDKLREAAVDGLLASTLGTRACGDAKDLGLRRKSPCEIVRALVPDLRDADKDQVASFATRQYGRLRLRDANQSAANFSYVLGNYADKVVLMGYNSAPRTHELWTGERLVDDFKDVYGASVVAGLLKEQSAKGVPAEEMNLSEKYYNAALGLFMRTIKFTYQDWRNDDLGLFADILRNIGVIAANTEEQQVYKLLLATIWTNHITTTAAFWDDTNDRLKFTGFAKTQADLEKKTVTVGDETIQINPVVGFMLVTPNRYNAALSAVGQGSAGQGPIPIPVAGNIRVIKSAWLANAALSGYSADDFYLGASNGDTMKVLRDRLFPAPRVVQIEAGATPDQHFLAMHAFRPVLAAQDFMQKGDWS